MVSIRRRRNRQNIRVEDGNKRSEDVKFFYLELKILKDIMCPRRRRCTRSRTGGAYRRRRVGVRRTGGAFGNFMKKAWSGIKSGVKKLASNPTVKQFVTQQVNKGLNTAMNKLAGTSGFYRRRRRRGGRRSKGFFKVNANR